ncbi:hypothetical protein BHE90_012693 [Fusarium euwallaceae]|uniref:Heterokaryon incompatibility domain-containing protein n=1 Tax=Fusarium euwallaceae TaxID=1147111 RepID=A0A430LAW4_9HYPO|nr:hypothetical protein BHE90_012693 [Fusarium euwallaceae]
MMDHIPENNPQPGQIGKGQPICNVCLKMMERLSSLPSYTQLPSGINALGKLRLASNCTIHPKLLSDFFPERGSYTTFELVSDNDNPGLCISFDEYFLSKFHFNLVKHSIGGNDIGHGRVNDSSWIDSAILRQWKDKCCITHDSKCGQTLASGRLPASHAVWLVDTHKYCLVPVQPRYQYVALSYIWGTKKMLTTQRDNLTELQKENALSTDITGLNGLVQTYGARQFTFPEDTLSAFAGFSTAISNIFLGGFIQGLPIMFLDAALLWKVNTYTQWPQPGSRNKVYRKVPSKAQGECPPTWSWAGWATAVDYSSWIGASDYIRYSKTMCFYSDECRTEPLVQWYARDTKESEPKLIPYHNEWFKYRQRFLNREEGDLPPGWTRLKSDRSMVTDDKYFRPWKPREETPAFYYVHDDAPETEFWYPIPIIKSSQTSNDCQWGRYLSCRTQKGLFWRGPSKEALQENPDARALGWERSYPFTSPKNFANDPIDIYLQDQSGLFAGYLVLHAGTTSSGIDAEDEEDEATEARYTNKSHPYGLRRLKNLSTNVENHDSFTAKQRHKEQAFQVVAISKGHAFPNQEEDYDFINVLWVEWVDGIAYRKGLGRVLENIWERQPLEDIELILG